MTNVMRNVLQAAEKSSCVGQAGREGSKSEVRGYLNPELWIAPFSRVTVRQAHCPEQS